MGLIKKKMASEEEEDTLDEALRTEAKIEELPSDDNNSDFEDVEDNPKPSQGPSGFQQQDLPLYLREATLGLFHTEHETTTSTAQQKVTAECLPYLLGQETQGFTLNAHGLPRLRREQHAAFLRAQLDKLPAPYVAIDASRPWFFYWTMAGLSFLGEDVNTYKERLIETVRPLQNPTGGFGGGHGQLSHCACSYATVLALACVGGLDMVDRNAMWRWLGSVKQSDGGFRMAVGAEEDIRGAYCAMTIITLLNLPLELPPEAPARRAGLTTFLDGLGEWVGSCQTYEGGIAGAPTNEAHGAYAFCALACLSIIDAPHKSIPRYLDVEILVHWLAARQTQPEGGFQGRQEKLVDACYSHWVGGCWDLIQAALLPPQTITGAGAKAPNDLTNSVPAAKPKDLWSRAALIRYLLTCCQQKGAKKAGMRDKPSARPDAYHTCYSLAGLSHAQNRFYYDGSAAAGQDGVDASGRLMAAFRWKAEKPSQEEMAEGGFEEGDRVGFVHPVFVVPMGVVEEARREFEKRSV